MKIEIFGRPICAKCQTTKNKIKFLLDKWELKNKIEVIFFDMDTATGLMEASYNDVIDIQVVIIKKNENILHRWNDEIPKSADIEKIIKENLEEEGKELCKV